LGVTGSSWVKSNPSTSGSNFSFDVTYASLAAEDIRVLVSPQAASDLAGNLQVESKLFTEQVSLATLSAQFSVDTVRQNAGSQQSTVTLTFPRPVWGLDSSDFSFPTNGATCSLGSIAPSSGPSSSYTIPFTCTATGNNNLSTLTLRSGAVKDFASVAGPASMWERE
jgi:hypothetical protein